MPQTDAFAPQAPLGDVFAVKLSLLPLLSRPKNRRHRFVLPRHDLENRISVLMGGRAAEALIFDGEVSTGASDDLQRATEIATEMVTRYGMIETIGSRIYAPPPSHWDYGEPH